MSILTFKGTGSQVVSFSCVHYAITMIKLIVLLPEMWNKWQLSPSVNAQININFCMISQT